TSKDTGSLATLRNGLVHKISNVEFTFTSYIADLKGKSSALFLNILGHGVVDQVKVGEALVSRHDIVRSNPKLANVDDCCRGDRMPLSRARHSRTQDSDAGAR